MDFLKYAIIRINKGDSRIKIDLPYTDTGNMEDIKFYKALGKYILTQRDHYAEVNVSHRDWVIEQLRYLYEGVWEYREYSATGTCDIRCQQANIFNPEDDEWEKYRESHCVCSCGGEFHGGGGDWQYVIGDTLISKTIKVVNRFYPTLDWRLTATPLPSDHAVHGMTKPLAPAEESE